MLNISLAHVLGKKIGWRVKFDSPVESNTMLPHRNCTQELYFERVDFHSFYCSEMFKDNNFMTS